LMGWLFGRAGWRVGCAAIVAAGGVGLGLSVHHDVQLTGSVTTSKFIARANAQLRQAECVFDAVRLMVPEGAAVYISNPRSLPADKLVEWATPWAVPVADVADARYRLTLVPPHFPFPLTHAAPDPASGRCDGVTLQVARL
jgi:hypothetical protein